MKNRFLILTLISLLLFPILGTELVLAQESTVNKSALVQSGGIYFIARVGAGFISLAASLITWSLDINTTIKDSPVLKAGWPIARDITNLGFVFFIILIAFATILRRETYALKQTLWKLIVAALLVNFSLLLVAPIIDLGGLLTNFFIQKAIDNPSDLAAGIAGSLSVQSFVSEAPRGWASIGWDFLTGGFTNLLLDFLTNLVFTVFFTAIAAITMFGLAAMLYIRYLALTFLLTIMPLAWLLWIWPDTEHLWKEWWSNFTKWVWFGPAMSFFIFLALKVAEQGAATGIPKVLDTTFANTSIISGAGQRIAQMIMVMGILIGGLITANKMGIAGAQMTMGAATGFKNLVVKRGGGYLWQRTKEKALSAGQGVDKKTGKKKESYARQLSTKLSSGKMFGVALPGLQTIGGALSKQISGVQEGAETYRKENLEKLTNDELVARAKGPAAFLRDIEVAGMARELTRRKDKDGKFLTDPKYMDQQRMVDFLKVADRFGASKDVLAVRPDLAPHIQKTVSEAHKQYVKEDTIEQVPKEVYQWDPLNSEKAEEVRKIFSDIRIPLVAKFGNRSADDKNEFLKTMEALLQEESKKDPDKRDEKLVANLKDMANVIRKSSSWSRPVDFDTLKPFLSEREIKKIKKEEGEEDEDQNKGQKPAGFEREKGKY